MSLSAPALVRPQPLGLEGVPRGLVLVLMGLAAAGAVLLPLATYVTTLAIFGMPHVIQELRYVRHRFGAWAGLWLIPVGIGLAGICLTRLLGTFAWLDPAMGRGIELGLVLGIVAASAPLWARGPWWSKLAGCVVVVAVGVGMIFAPILTFFVIAIGHNWTPVPFILEAVQRRDRALALAVCGVAFVLLPAGIATGLPWAAASAVGVGAADFSLIAAGDLSSQLGAYLPAGLAGWGHAQHLFSAIVFAQCTHYIMVLAVLPSLRGGPVGPMRTGAWTTVGIVAVTLVTSLAFIVDFSFGRSFYGAFSSVHAWVEVPLFLLVLSAARAPER